MKTASTQTEPNELYGRSSSRGGLQGGADLMTTSTSSIGYHRRQLTSSATFLASGCCPASVVHEVDHSLFFDDKSSRTSGHSRRASAKSLRSAGDDLTEDDPQDFLENEDELEGSDNVMLDESRAGGPRTPSYPSYHGGQFGGQHSHQHQFVIRTIPSFLNLSPRASYHRLNIKHRDPIVKEFANGSNQELTGDTILLCCFPNDLLWARNDSAALGNDSVTLTASSNRNRINPVEKGGFQPIEFLHSPPTPPENLQIGGSRIESKYAEHLSWQILKDVEPCGSAATTDYIQQIQSAPQRIFKSCSEHGILDHADQPIYENASNFLAPNYIPERTSSTRATYSSSGSSRSSSSSSNTTTDSALLPPPPPPLPPELLLMSLNDKQAQTAWTRSLEQMLLDGNNNKIVIMPGQIIDNNSINQEEDDGYSYPADFIVSSGYAYRPKSVEGRDSFPASPFHQHRSFSESELYVQFNKENFNSGQNLKNILSKELNRRHSAIADLAIVDPMDYDVPSPPPPPPPLPSSLTDQLDSQVFESVIAAPPPGFEDVIDQQHQQHDYHHRYSGYSSSKGHGSFGSSSRVHQGSGSSSSSGQQQNPPLMSPESELSTSQVTSVTNCSDMLATTGTTFSSDVTGSGTSGSGIHTGSQLSTSVQPEYYGMPGASTSRFHPISASGRVGQSTSAGRFIGGRYNLEFDDDDGDADEYDVDEDDDEFDDGCGFGTVNRIRLPGQRIGSGLKGTAGGRGPRVLPAELSPQSSPYRNADFAVAEGSSQDEEEKAKYEFEFETEEEEYGEEDLQLDEPNLTKPKRPNELEFGVGPSAFSQPQSQSYYRKPAYFPPSPPELPMAPEPPTELMTPPSSGRVSSKSLPENLYRSGDEEHDDQDSYSGLRNDGTRFSGRLPRTKSSTLGRLSHRMTPPHLLHHSFYSHCSNHEHHRSGSDVRDLTPVQDIYSSDPSTAIDLSIANTVIEKQREEEEAEEAEEAEREKRVMMRSTDDDELGEISEENELVGLRPSDEERRTRDFSSEIFDKLKISPEKYHPPTIYPGPPSQPCSDADDHSGSLKQGTFAHVTSPHLHYQQHSGGRHHHHHHHRHHHRHHIRHSPEECPVVQASKAAGIGLKDLGRQDTLEDTTTTTTTTITERSSRREDIPLLGDLSDSASLPPVNYRHSSAVRDQLLRQLSPTDESTDNDDSGSDEGSIDLNYDDPSNGMDDESDLLLDDDDDEDTPKNVDRVPLPQVNHNRRRQHADMTTSPSSGESLSPDALPEDSTTSGSFMLDDASPYADSLYGVMPYFDEQQPNGDVKSNHHTNTALSNGNGNHVSKKKSNKRSGQLNAVFNGSNGDQEVIRQIGGQSVSSFRVRFEQRQQRKPAQHNRSIPNSTYDSHRSTSSRPTLVTNLDDIDDEIYERPQPMAQRGSSGGDSFGMKGFPSSGGTKATSDMDAFSSIPQDRDHTTPGSGGNLGTLSGGPFRTQHQTHHTPPTGAGPNSGGPIPSIPPVVSGGHGGGYYQQGAHQHHHHHHQFCPIDVYEQSSQATERDLERSEFSLQHQNSELDEDESLTFENLNNQSLSVIDEDGAAAVSSDRQATDSDEQKRQAQPVYLERYDSKEMESERDLSLEAVLQEESKALERQVRAAQQAKTAAISKFKASPALRPTGMALEPEEALPPYKETSIVFSDEDIHDSTTHSHPTLQEEEAVGSRLYSPDDKTTLHDSSADILGSHLDDERTELRDERIALLGDSSEYTHSGLPLTPDDKPVGSNGNGAIAAILMVPPTPSGAKQIKQQFSRKLAEIEQRLMRASGGVPETGIETEKQHDEECSPEEVGGVCGTGMTTATSGTLEENTNNTLTYSSYSQNGTSHTGTNTGTNTISECSSSVMTPDLSGPPSSHHPVPILKRSSGKNGGAGGGGHRHHRSGGSSQVVFVQHHHHREGTSPIHSSTSSAPHHHYYHSPAGDVSTGGSASGHHGHSPPTESAQSTTGTSGGHCCARCYHRHHVGQPGSSHYHHATLPRAHYHHHGHHIHHHHHHPTSSGHHHRSSKSSSGKLSLSSGRIDDSSGASGHPHRTDGLVEQARARSLTRTLGGGTSPIDAPGPVYTSKSHRRRSREMGDNTSEDASDPSRDQTPTNEHPPNTPPQRASPCNQHYFTCSYCGEATMPPNMAPGLASGTSHSRLKTKRAMPPLTKKSVTVEDVYFDVDDEENDIGVHTESYRSSMWIYIGRKEELFVWGSRNRTITPRPLNVLDPNRLGSSGGDSADTNSISTNRSESEESTCSEKSFRKNYESVTHRLIHRKASIELYRRILDRTFSIDKSMTLTRDNNEFGFRIHGSRPVVVSAIEKGTSAEHKGLEVGDIIVAVNTINVLDASHSEVVKLAHTGSSKLMLEVASTASAFRIESAVAMPGPGGAKQPEGPSVIINGYLKRFVEKLAEQIGHSTDKMTNTKLWRRRWFVLKSDACLYWYRNPKSIEPIGAISLQGYCSGIVNECLFGQEHLFRLVGYKSSPVKYFAATDHDTAQQWVKALNQNSVRFSNSDTFIETTLNNIHRNPLSFPQPDCYGFLAKFNQPKKNWKQRYFVLKDACLYFYADANSNTALGLFYLHGYKVQSCSMFGKKHTFEIMPSSNKFRNIWLCADSDNDKKRWLAALEYSIDRWIELK